MHPVEFKDGVLNAPIDQVRLGQDAATGVDATLAVTCDKNGNIVGDLSHLPDHIRQQLETPETREMIQKQYKQSRNPSPVANPKPRYLNDGGRVNYQHMKPAGISSKEFRKLRRKTFHDMRKAAIKVQRSIH